MQNRRDRILGSPELGDKDPLWGAATTVEEARERLETLERPLAAKYFSCDAATAKTVGRCEPDSWETVNA